VFLTGLVMTALGYKIGALQAIADGDINARLGQNSRRAVDALEMASPNPQTRTGGANARRQSALYSVLVVAYPNERDLQLQTRRLLALAPGFLR
jgi:hypothetical protein